MELRQLRSVLMIAETGSLNGAARRLRVAQPALSRQIRLLEEELGTALFVRHARGMVATEAGELLVERVRRGLREIDQARSDLSALSGQVTGQVAIGMLPSVSELMAARFARAMRKRYPLVRLRIMTGLAAHILEWLGKQEIDVAIVSEPLVTAGLESQPLVEEPLYLVGSSTLPGMRARNVKLRDLAKYPLILPSTDFGLRGGIDRAVRNAGIELDVAIEANSLHVQRNLIRAGIGYALLPSSVALRDVDGDFVAARIVDPPIFRRIGLGMATMRRRPLTARCAAETMVDEIGDSLSQGEWPGARSLIQRG
jgi:DNA-binding transcriptional LysR family regulator